MRLSLPVLGGGLILPAVAVANAMPVVARKHGPGPECGLFFLRLNFRKCRGDASIWKGIQCAYRIGDL